MHGARVMAMMRMPVMRMRPSRTRPGHAMTFHASGLTLVECMMAMTVLSIAVLGLSYVATAGHQHLQQAENASRAIRLAEHLMEEMASRQFDGNGVSRSDWHLQDYDGFIEASGNLRDFTGTLYPDDDQRFFRSVSMTDATETVAELGSMTLSGKRVTVTAGLSGSHQWQLIRFFPEPVSP